MLSIIVPLYNREDLISQTIESVSRQTADAWELIVVDDGSDDRGPEIVRGIAASDQRVRLLDRKCSAKGAPICRNIGLKNALGEYCMFLDSDDLLSPDCVQRRLSFAQLCPKSDFLVFPTGLFDLKPGDRLDQWYSQPGHVLHAFLETPVWHTSSPLWRKASLLKLGGFREGLLSWQDWELHVRALSKGLQFNWAGGDPDTFVRRGHMGRISKRSEVKPEHLFQRRELFSEIVRMLQDDNQWDDRCSKLMVRKYLILAIQLNRIREESAALEVLDEMAALLTLPLGELQWIRRYYEFEINAFYRGSLIGRVLRPFVKRIHWLKLGERVIPRARRR